MKALPVPAGESPFHVKGLVYKAIFRGVERRFSDGRSRLLASLDPELCRFAEQPFLAASMYDVLPVVPLSEAAAATAKMELMDYLLEESTVQAREDLAGVYKVILAVISPELAVRAVVKIALRYYDFGDAHIEEIRARGIRAIRTGVPGYLCDWYVATSQPYFLHVVRAAGAEEATIRVTQSAFVGVKDGYPMRNIVFDVGW